MSKLFTYIFNKRQTSVFPMKFTLEVSGFWQRPNEVNPGQVPHAIIGLDIEKDHVTNFASWFS